MNTIQKLASQFPVGGMALHGTSRAKAEIIRKEGLNWKYSNYICPIPKPLVEELSKSEPDALYKRTVGTILFASCYAFKKGLADLQIDDSPTVIIFRNPNAGYKIRDLSVRNYDTQTLIGGMDSCTRGGYYMEMMKANKPLSFGKTNVSMPPVLIAGTASLTLDEIAQLRGQVERILDKEAHMDNSLWRNCSLQWAVHRRLIFKTLIAMKKIIEKGSDSAEFVEI